MRTRPAVWLAVNLVLIVLIMPWPFIPYGDIKVGILPLWALVVLTVSLIYAVAVIVSLLVKFGDD